MPRKKMKGENRKETKFQEITKKLKSDTIKSKFKNIKKYLITTFTEKKYTRSNSDVDKVPTDYGNNNDNNNVEENHLLSHVVDVHKDANNDEDSTLLSETLVDTKMDNQIIPQVVVDESCEKLIDIDRQNNNEDDDKSQLNIAPQPKSRNKSPVTVQEWVDALPLTPTTEDSRPEAEIEEPIEPVLEPGADSEGDLTLGAEAVLMCEPDISEPPQVIINGCQESSEADSHCSSVDSLLEARKPNPEDILLNLGFGGSLQSCNIETGRIPKRFLKPSTMPGVDIHQFLQKQHELIQTYESGLYGYRGLSGPSHSHPSEIVAKIMEKIRERTAENEVTAMISSPIVRKRCISSKQDQSNTKFSKIARNMVTKIRYTPGSVLTPDNRRWLDSQGDKSPETSRRIIIGQQSFTFSTDGNLIESPPSSVAASNSGKDEVKNASDDNETNETELDDEEKENMSEYVDDEEENENMEDITNNEESSQKFDSLRNKDDWNKELSLKEEFRNLQLSDEESNISCRRDYEEYDVNLDNSFTESTIAVSIDQLSDSATESEIAASENLSNEILKKQYQELINLQSKIENVDEKFEMCSENHFAQISPEQRSEVQSFVIKKAINVYLNKLKEDEVHSEIRKCLLREAQGVVDLLDTSSCGDSSKLSTVVRQMTLLLQHQTQLNAQIDELAKVEKKSSSCHELCDHVLKRVEQLELLVQRNAHELAHMKSNLQNNETPLNITSQ